MSVNKNSTQRVFMRSHSWLLLSVGQLGCLLLLIVLQAGGVFAASNSTINFQARLLSNGGNTVSDGDYNVEFKIYDIDTSSGSSQGSCTGDAHCLWTETRTSTNKARVVNGYLTANLGSVNSFGSTIKWDQELWLTMNIGGTGSPSWDGEMSPRLKLTSVPYAFRAAKLATLAGSTAVLQFDTSFGQPTTITLPDPGGTGTANVCYQGASACGFAAGSGTAFLQSGNSFGVTGLLGTIDNYGLQIKTNNIVRATIATNNTMYLGNGVTAGSPSDFTLSGTGSSTTGIVGGTLTLQGGDATVGSANGGGLNLSGGAGIGTGVRGLVSLGPTAVTSTTNSSCAVSCTIAQSNVDSYASITVNATAPNLTITLPDPTNTTAGRLLYVIGANGSSDFTLGFNSGGTFIDIAMRQNSTATLVWDGVDWTAAGAGNSTTLQSAYENGSNPSNVAEIKLDSTHGTIDLQDADTTIGSDLFNIRGSNSSTLGTVLFGVSNTGKVTIQNISDQDASFRVLNQAGNYITNVNSAANYVINNGVRTPDNNVINPGFEAGGQLTSGEQGWNGPAQGSIVNGTSNAHGGNYYLSVTPNGTNLDFYPGTYFAVQPGETIYAEAWVKNSAGANGDGGIQLTFYDKDLGSATTSTNYSGLPGTSYVLKTISTTVPSGKYYVRYSAAVRSTATTGTFYFDDFYLKRTSEQGTAVFKNSADSTAAFVLQSAGAAQTLFTADTTNNNLKVGDSDGSASGLTMFVLDSATADPSTLTNRSGGLYYRSDTGLLQVVLNGAIQQICTTGASCPGYAASAGSTVSLQATSPGTVQTGNFAITGTGILTQLQTQDLSSGNTNALTIRTGNATSGNSGNLTIDVGTASGTKGGITLGSSGVTTTMPGKLIIQGTSPLELGASSAATGSLILHNNVGSRTVTIAAAGANPTSSSWVLTLPQDPASSSGYCLKATDTSGSLGFSDCGVGATVTLQDVYNNSSSPALITLANGKNINIASQDTSTDPSIIFDLQCTTCSSSSGISDGRFAVQNGGTDVLTVNPNSTGIVLAAKTQIGSATTNSTQTYLQLDSSSAFADSVACTATSNQGALYYSTSTHSLRTCKDSAWTDVVTSTDLGMLLFGVVPESGSSNQGDLPSLATAGVSGPCKVSWASNTSVTINACVAYSAGRRIKISSTTLSTNSASSPNTLLSTTNIWAHICIDSTDGTAKFTNVNGSTSETANLPTFSMTNPVLCLASVKGSAQTNTRIAGIYDTRTFTGTNKEPVTIETTASSIGWLVNISNGNVKPVASGTDLRGVVVATDGTTSTGNPNAIIAYSGPAWVKANAGTVAKYVQNSSTVGYANTTNSFPASGAYAVLGFARTGYSITLTSGECTAASSCVGSMYVNLNIR